MTKYYVIGGVYEDTTFRKITGEETREGPFVTYDEAKQCWQTLSWKNVDDCHARFTVLEDRWRVKIEDDFNHDSTLRGPFQSKEEATRFHDSMQEYGFTAELIDLNAFSEPETAS